MGELAIRTVTLALLLVLLCAIVALHFLVPPGSFRIAAVYLFAMAQVGLVLFGFMRLGSEPLLARLAAAGIAFWLAVFFGFTLLDYLHR